MSKSATILGLVAIASAGVPAYGGSSAPAYGGSSAAPAYGSSSVYYSAEPSSSYAWPASSAAPSYPASSEPAGYGSSSWVVSAIPSSSYIYSAVPSSSYASYSASASAVIPSTPPYPPCWSACFEEAGITSESDLCGNVEVDACIQKGCCVEESWAYWQWYDSYCPAPSSSYVAPSSTVPVGPYSSSSVPSSVPSSPVANCWSACFAENGITSEDQLCGNTAVDACIHDTCSCDLDKAYWDWYTGFCVAASTSVVTTVTVYTPTATPDSPITTTYYYTSEYSYTPITSSPATGLPVPPASPVAPYGGWSTPAGPASGAAATGTAYPSPSASQWAPVPATGAGANTKPGVIFAAAMALIAFF